MTKKHEFGSEGPNIHFGPDDSAYVSSFKWEVEKRLEKLRPKSVGKMVKEFHTTYGAPVGEKPALPDRELSENRWRLISEEYEELKDEFKFNNNLPGFAKELADLVYVLYGTAESMGIDLDEVIAEVHRSNMTKLGADGKPIYREDGKVLKGPNYEEADIARVLGL